jgi:hypothetical protein
MRRELRHTARGELRGLLRLAVGRVGRRRLQEVRRVGERGIEPHQVFTGRDRLTVVTNRQQNEPAETQQLGVARIHGDGLLHDGPRNLRIADRGDGVDDILLEARIVRVGRQQRGERRDGRVRHVEPAERLRLERQTVAALRVEVHDLAAHRQQGVVAGVLLDHDVGQADAGQDGLLVRGDALTGSGFGFGPVAGTGRIVAALLGLQLGTGGLELRTQFLDGVTQLLVGRFAERLLQRVVAREHHPSRHGVARVDARGGADDVLIGAQLRGQRPHVVRLERHVRREAGRLQNAHHLLLRDQVDFLAVNVATNALAHLVGRLLAEILLFQAGGAEHLDQHKLGVRIGRALPRLCLRDGRRTKQRHYPGTDNQRVESPSDQSRFLRTVNPARSDMPRGTALNRSGWPTQQCRQSQNSWGSCMDGESIARRGFAKRGDLHSTLSEQPSVSCYQKVGEEGLEPPTSCV